MLAWMAAALGGSCRPQFSGTPRDGDPIGHQADITEASAWGWQPRRHLPDEIVAVVDWIEHGAF